jgi:hypothetical protein
MMMRFVMATTAAVLLGCGSAVAQVGGMSTSPGSSPLGMTTPLGMGPGSPVPPAGTPLGATELASPGLSPTMSGTGVIAQCAGIGGSMPQTSFGIGSSTAGTTSGMGSSMTGTSTAGTSGSTSLFDGGGITGTTSGACAAIGSSSLAGPAASASSPGGVGSSGGRLGIPMGSTELGAGGLSPPAVLATPTPSTTLSTMGTSVTVPCPTTPGTSTGLPTGMSTSAGSC